VRKSGEPSPEAGNKELELARNLVAGTIYESHFEWQNTTSWYSLLLEIAPFFFLPV
jgi:uncharacterized membrane protein